MKCFGFTLRVPSPPNSQVSDGGRHQALERANEHRPPPFAPPKSCSLILPRVNEGLCGKDLQRTGLDNRMLAEVPDALTHNLR
jgi:hypothetical protein